ncbi:MAG: DUF3137 domain-containing protein [Bacteroidia bacterium]
MGILKEIIGEKYEPIWKQFAEEIGASYVDGHYGDSDSVVANPENWKITFDIHTSYATSGSRTYEADYTRIRAPFKSPDNLKFVIYRTQLFSAIGKLFGAQDIVIGHPDFDKAFIIKGNDEYKIQVLFSNNKVRELITAQKEIHLEIIDTEGTFEEKIPEGICELYFLIDGIIKNVEQLKSLYNLYVELLNQLESIGSATKKQ